MVHITVMSCCSNGCCQTSVRLLANFAFRRNTRVQERALSCCDTRLRTSHQTWPPNRPDLNSVNYRLLRVIQECVCQKQQGMSNIVDELWLLTELYFINRMTYISQGRVEAAIRIGGQLQFCCKFTSVSVPKIIKIQCSWTKLLEKIKGCNFFAPQCTSDLENLEKTNVRHIEILPVAILTGSH